MMSTYALGQRVVFDCCTRKKSIVEAIDTFDTSTEEGIDACLGALDACVEIIGSLYAMGGNLGGEIGEVLNRYSSRDLLMIAHRVHSKKKPTDQQNWNLWIVLAAEAIRSQMVVTVSYPVAESEKQKIIPVEVVSMPTPEKVPVEVLSMPGRETETVIKRDGDGNIVSTSQIERDV